MTRKQSRLAATSVMVAMFAYALYLSMSFKGLGQWFPLLAASVGLLIAMVALVLLATGHEPGVSAFDISDDNDPTVDDDPTQGASDDAAGEPADRFTAKPTWQIILAILAFPALVAALGTMPAVIIWVGGFLWFVARTKWWVAAMGVAGTIVALLLFQLYIGMVLPGSIFVN